MIFLPGILISVLASLAPSLKPRMRPLCLLSLVCSQEVPRIRPVGGGHPGFVLAGRSLREVEKRESQLSMSVVGAWIFALVGSLVAWIFALGVSEKMTGR